ncbi:nitrilase-related carbon-nitrogen hydrolase [Bryobacter aggregatus]|uniref:nitrilase-related carbon-nitrogen hydrolase n=1 Tax=Bryobacter aggregatus TaxID=360054 RepID=UPI0004E2187F|nr:nitrilase-related carbon-nitrogen hydrolase [Bryobacter aggregatus]
MLFALATGILLRFVVGLEPVPYLAWVVPALLLWGVLQAEGIPWRLLVIATCLIGYQANAVYYLRVMPMAIACTVVAGQSLLWLFVLAETRRVVLRVRRPWTMLAYPVFWVAVDTLLANFAPDGNWASLAYTQADFLPLIQTASLFGVSGVLFLLCLASSAIAVSLVLGLRGRENRIMLAGTMVLIAAALVFGTIRLQSPPAAKRIPIGIASIDDAIGLQAQAPYIARIQAAYDAQLAALASAGARLVLLPEKIAVVSAADAPAWRERFAASALRHRISILVGIGVQHKDGIANDAWLFSPDGSLDAVYQKQILAPPERAGYLAGHKSIARDIEGTRFGIAICKDMHFATLGRTYGELHPAAMLVPAWDFSLDGWMGARMTALRGIENGFTVVRAAREGLLTVTDAYGRIVAEADSKALPGQRLWMSVPVDPQLPKLYTRIGNCLGWLCVAIGAYLMWFSRTKPKAMAA